MLKYRILLMIATVLPLAGCATPLSEYFPGKPNLPSEYYMRKTQRLPSDPKFRLWQEAEKLRQEQADLQVEDY